MRGTKRTSGTHGYICECSNPSCVERIYLNPGDYERLRKEGAVVTASCARDKRRKVIRRYGHVVVVETSWGRVGRPG